MLSWASTQMSGPILECFGSISYLFRESIAPLTWPYPLQDFNFRSSACAHVSLDTLYEEHLLTMMRRADSALAAAKFDALVVMQARRRSSSWRSKLPLQGKSAFQGLGADHRQPPVRADLRTGVPAAGAVSSAERLLAQAGEPAARALDAYIELIPTPDPAAASGEWAKLGRVAFIGPPGCFGPEAAATQNDPDLLPVAL